MMGAAHKEHEFDAADESQIAELASGMKFCAVFELVIGVLYAVLAVYALINGAIPAVLVHGVTAAVWIALALIQQNAAREFRNVVDTQGSDITFLMSALRHLRGYYSIKRTLYIIGIVLIAIGVVFFVLGK